MDNDKKATPEIIRYIKETTDFCVGNGEEMDEYFPKFELLPLIYDYLGICLDGDEWYK